MKQAIGLQRYFGMMFRSKNTEPIYWDFGEEVNVKLHTFFVFFPVRIIWKDKNLNVIEERIVQPWQHSQTPSKPFRYIEEYPIK